MSEHPSETAGEEDAEEDIFELEEDVTQPPLKKQRAPRSKVWKHFSKIGGERARCDHCKKIFVASSAKGISHLKKHFELTCPILRQKKDGNVPKSVTPKVASFKFDQERSRMDFATMVIKHN